ncbi:MAG: hypothetical protein KJP23_26225 [Deltaproteobacteria bacterium]|nr:hypothetical protein [Deltaproteobacteria bacterium]
MSQLLATKEASKFLNINEKMVYSQFLKKGCLHPKLPAKLLFKDVRSE